MTKEEYLQLYYNICKYAPQGKYIGFGEYQDVVPEYCKVANFEFLVLEILANIESRLNKIEEGIKKDE